MARIQGRFKKVAVFFDEMAKARLCESSSGSEHSPAESFADLSDLVNSFLERESGESGEREEVDHEEKCLKKEESEKYCCYSETKNELKRLLLGYEDDDVKRKIHAEVKEACRVIGGNSSSPVFKRRLMAWLRDRDFDAGLCKSKWEKTVQFPCGKYEYVDVNIAGIRYIIVVYLAGEFEIARPTDNYSSLLITFPPIFVGTIEELKQIIKLMSNAIKKSMKKMELHIPPWRRHGYMKAKLLASYKRTINELSAKNNVSVSDKDFVRKTTLGFEIVSSAISYYCREDFASKVGRKFSNLHTILD